MHNLPSFPTKSMSQEDSEVFSDKLLSVYPLYRVTSSNVHVSVAVKRIPVELPALKTSANDTVSIIEAESHSETVETARQQPVAVSPSFKAPEKTSFKKCFLHSKPKPNCKRCNEYEQSSKRMKI